MQTFFESFPRYRIAVIGDVMLDCYISGEVNRISPEAPVPVLRVTSENSVPGGAANVAANLATLGMKVTLVGLAGEDAARDELLTHLRALGDVDCTGILAVPGRPTTRKLRVIGAHQQIVRIDHEEILPVSTALEARFRAHAMAAIDTADVVVISDYGKGACSRSVLRSVLDHANASGRAVVVDPKQSDLALYRGAAVITPNRKELADATRMPVETDGEAAAAATVAQQICDADILLTRSEKGMSFFPVGGPPLHMPTVAQDIFDVSGAGDTVVAVLAASLAAGAPVADGMRMANHAAGIVVSKLGTARVTREELAASMAVDTASLAIDDGRTVDRDGAVALRALWARDRLSVGFANGCFDLLHPGHIRLLRQAAAACDRLIVALNSDASVARLKGPSRPLQDEASRATVIGAIQGVAAVTIFDEDTPHAVIQALQPDLLVKGSDYTIDRVIGADIVQARGGRVMLVDLDEGHSTSRIVDRSMRILASPAA